MVSIVDGVATTTGRIGPGLVALVGVTHTDQPATARKLADKIWNLRIMDDENGVMNLAVRETSKAILVVSQFTLYGDTTAGRRPSWIAAAPAASSSRTVSSTSRGPPKPVSASTTTEIVTARARIRARS